MAAKKNSTGSTKSPSTVYDERGTSYGSDKNGAMIVRRSKENFAPPTEAELQKMKELEVIRKHPTTTA
jgi:hypothetical protein